MFVNGSSMITVSKLFEDDKILLPSDLEFNAATFWKFTLINTIKVK